MYSVDLTNFPSIPEPFETYQEALKRAKAIGFESRVWFCQGEQTTLVAAYSPLYGLRVYNRELAGMETGIQPNANHI